MRYKAQKIDLFGDISKKDISHRYIFRSDSFFPFISYNRKDISFSWKDTSSGKKDIFFAPEDISPSAISSSKIKFAPPTYLKFSRRERFKFTFKTFFVQRIPNKSAFQHLSCLHLKRPFVTLPTHFIFLENSTSEKYKVHHFTASPGICSGTPRVWPNQS